MIKQIKPLKAKDSRQQISENAENLSAGESAAHNPFFRFKPAMPRNCDLNVKNLSKNN